MEIREKILSLEGETVVVVPKKGEGDSFLADVGKADKITDTAVFDVIGAPGENRREYWSIERIEDVVAVEE